MCMLLVCKMNYFMRHTSESLTFIVKLYMVYDSGQMRFCGNLLRNTLRIHCISIHITTLPMILSFYIRTMTNTFKTTSGTLLLWNKQVNPFVDALCKASQYIRTYLFQYLTNLMHRICFTIRFISCFYMFRAHVPETCRGMK
jgi:hypothetical protein